jgi:hypothetical protein
MIAPHQLSIEWGACAAGPNGFVSTFNNKGYRGGWTGLALGSRYMGVTMKEAIGNLWRLRLVVAVTAIGENRLYGMDASGHGAGFGRLARQTSGHRDPAT